jgi:phi LC3 family holin
MSNINWKVRFKNKTFWVTAIPALLLIIGSILEIFNIEIDFTGISDKIVDVIGAIFSLLSILGIVADPTTEGISDSELALTYEEPKSDSNNSEDSDYEEDE